MTHEPVDNFLTAVEGIIGGEAEKLLRIHPVDFELVFSYDGIDTHETITEKQPGLVRGAQTLPAHTHADGFPSPNEFTAFAVDRDIFPHRIRRPEAEYRDILQALPKAGYCFDEPDHHGIVRPDSTIYKVTMVDWFDCREVTGRRCAGERHITDQEGVIAEIPGVVRRFQETGFVLIVPVGRNNEAARAARQGSVSIDFPERCLEALQVVFCPEPVSDFSPSRLRENDMSFIPIELDQLARTHTKSEPAGDERAGRGSDDQIEVLINSNIVVFFDPGQEAG